MVPGKVSSPLHVFSGFLNQMYCFSEFSIFSLDKDNEFLKKGMNDMWYNCGEIRHLKTSEDRRIHII